ncbi:MAG: endonuclease domain-containing protein [Prevotella sp.]|nr:endonuclease domain-containing protein [Prevotella sp.]
MAYDYQTADKTLYTLLRDYARYNRNHPSEAEELLWNYLKAKGLGVSFKRQHIIGGYIVDFACLPSKLVVELDGGYHQMPHQQVSDALRQEWLEDRGYRVVRFTNEELFNDVNKVLQTIEANL